MVAESRQGACSLRILKRVILLLLFSCSVLTDSLRPHGLTSWTAARQASLSFTISRSLLRLTSIELVMLSYHLIFCLPLVLLPSIFPGIISLKNKIVPCLRKGNIFRRMSEYALHVQRLFFFLNIKPCIREANIEGNCFRKHDVISDFPSPGHSFLLNRQRPAFGPAPLCLCRSQNQCARNWTGRMRGWCRSSRWAFPLERSDSLGLWFRSPLELGAGAPAVLWVSLTMWIYSKSAFLAQLPLRRWWTEQWCSVLQGYGLRLLCGIN